MKYIGIVFLFYAGCTSGNNNQMLKIQVDELTKRLQDVESTNSGFLQRLKDMETDITVLKDRMSVIRRKTHYKSGVINPSPRQVLPVERLQPEKENKYNSHPQKVNVKHGLNVSYDSIDDEGHPYNLQNQDQDTNNTEDNTVKITASKEISQEPQSMYRSAFDAYRHGEPDRAINLFKKFLKKYPKNDLSDNAIYWIGECYYDKRAFDRAKGYFTTVVTKYPKGNKVADAMLKIGLCNEMQNRFKDAKRLFKAVMLGYPDSSAARIAMKRIQELQ